MTYDITQIVELILTLLMAIVTGLLVPYIKSKTTSTQQETVNQWIKIAVLMAEQLIQGDSRGEERRQLVKDFLSRNNITIDDDKLNATIEAVVCTLNNGLIQIDS